MFVAHLVLRHRVVPLQSETRWKKFGACALCGSNGKFDYRSSSPPRRGSSHTQIAVEQPARRAGSDNRERERGCDTRAP